MTLMQPTQPTQPTRPLMHLGDIGARLRQEGHHALLDDVLHAVVVDVLGSDSRVALAGEEWRRIEDAIRGPVVAAATAAIERLAADLETSLSHGLPELVRRLGDHRLRAEMGYD